MEPLIIASIELKNKEIKKLFDVVKLYFDIDSLPSVMTSFMACDDAIEGEIAALKAELHDTNVSKDIFRTNADHLRAEVFERANELRKANNQIASLKEDLKTANTHNENQKKTIDGLVDKLNEARKHGENLASTNGKLVSDWVDLKAKVNRLERNLAEQLEGSVTYQVISDLQKENAKLKDEIIELNAQHDEDVLAYDELDEKYQAALCEIRQLKKALEKAEGPKDLKFGDVVNVSWYGDDYMFIERVNDMLRLYNITEKRLCYMNNHEHYTKTGECSFVTVG